VMQRATGIDLLADLAEFFRSFAGMTEGFRERASLVNELLADSRTAFVLVTSPRRAALEEAVWFHHRLMEAGLPFAGVIANRVHQGGEESDPAELARLLGDELGHKVARTYEDERRMAERDHAGLAELRRRIGRKPIVEVPHLHDDVHDLDGLRQMDEYLFRR
jgi:anion-transporting  ArsA/GET3 family ATPase